MDLSNPIFLPLAFLAGAGLWSFAEYCLHCGLGHVAKKNAGFKREHMMHHADTTYFTATLKKVLVATPVLLAMFALTAWGAGLALAGAFTLGFALGYVAYEVVHRRTHTHAPWEAYGRWARKHHLHHHFANPNMNHGVTSPIWDVVFGTYERPSTITIPPKQVAGVRWLFRADGQVVEQYADDYRLMRPRFQT